MPMKLICSNCDHEWRYTSRSKYVTCPSCQENNWTLTEDEIKRHKLEESIVFMYHEEPAEMADEEIEELTKHISNGD